LSRFGTHDQKVSVTFCADEAGDEAGEAVDGEDDRDVGVLLDEEQPDQNSVV